MYKDKKVTLKKSRDLASDLQKTKSSLNYAVAHILLTLNAFHDLIDLIRLKISYKTNADSLTLEEKEELRIGALAAIHKFDLTPNWSNPIKKAVLTNKLSVPEEFSSIGMYSPGDDVIIDRYPSIYFSRHTSITNLRTWITENQGVIKNSLSKLPVIKKTKISPMSILVGQLVILAKKRGKETYPEIFKYLNNEFEKQQQFEEILSLIGKFDDNDLRNAERAFLKALAKYYS